MKAEVGNEDMREPEEVVQKKKGKLLFPLPVVFGVGIATLFILLAVFAGQAGLERRLKTAVAPGGQAEVRMKEYAVTVNEDEGFVRIKVNVVNPTDQTIQLIVRTLVGGSATGGDGPGGEVDYGISEETVTLEPGDAYERGILDIPIYDDNRAERDEKFRVTIAKLKGGGGSFRIPIGKKETLVTITEGCNIPNPSNLPEPPIKCNNPVEGNVKSSLVSFAEYGSSKYYALRNAVTAGKSELPIRCSSWPENINGLSPEDNVKSTLCCDKLTKGVEGCQPKEKEDGSTYERCPRYVKKDCFSLGDPRVTYTSKGNGWMAETKCWVLCHCTLACEPINPVESSTPSPT